MMTRAWVIVTSLALLLPFSGCAPLSHQAAYDGDTKTVLALLDQGLNVNTRHTGFGNPKYKGTMLMIAADEGHLDTVRALLERGADPNLKDSGGYSPLHFAAMSGHAQVAQLLLTHGAIASSVTIYGETPLDLAKKLGHTALIGLLQQAEERELGLARTPGAPPRVAPVTAPAPAVSVITSDVDRVPALGVPRKKHAYAVVIGIEQYREKLPKADFADRDARLVGEYLTKVMGYPEENVIVRTNDRATRTDLEKYFEAWLPNNVERESSVFIYYSGHGAPNTKSGEAFLVPYDGDPTFVDRTGYPIKRLYAALAKLPTTDVTVVLDSCFSGAGGRSVIAKGMRPMALTVEDPMLGSGDTIVLAASSGDQVSGTYEEQGHGLLTYYFLKGLQGDGDTNRDGVIEMTELYDYVKPNVQRIARKQHNNEQTPQLLGKPDLLKRGGGRLVDGTRP
jgi:hypothetical protein